MSTSSKKQILKQIQQRRYLNKDFDSLKADIRDYVKTHVPDLSESGLGGLMLDAAAYVGDVCSFYLDHQFHEVWSDTAVESRNIERHIKKAGVSVVGAAPAVVQITFYIEIPATGVRPVPNTTALPIIHAGTRVRSASGIEFELTEDLDFREVTPAGSLVANVEVGTTNANNEITSFVLSLSGECISGFRSTESFSIGPFVPFKKLTLSKENVTEITRVFDNAGNEYHEVGYLTQDTVYKAIPNVSSDSDIVKNVLMPIPAPYRFIKSMALDSRLTTITLGGGSAESIDDDIVPDPSEFAVPLYGKKIFSRFTLNPGNLLQTTTLGTVAPNTTLTVTYRYGGGLSHNIDVRTVRGISSLSISFPNNPSVAISQFVRRSIDTVNLTKASGGDDAPTTEQLKIRIPAIVASQGRIVTDTDLIARVYTMPSNFGRVFRASVQPNPNNPLTSQLYIISRNAEEQLELSPDTLKKNLMKFLNEYRMTSDAIDILDAMVINVKVEFAIVADPSYTNSNLVVQNVISKLKTYFNIKNFEIDQPIMLDELQNIIFNTAGVLTVNNLQIKNMIGAVGNNLYSSVQFDVEANTDRRIIFGPPGSIFEIKYKDTDIIGTAN